MLILRPVRRLWKTPKFLIGYIYLRGPGYTWGGAIMAHPRGSLWKFGVRPGLEMVAEKLSPTSAVKNRSQHSQLGTDTI